MSRLCNVKGKSLIAPMGLGILVVINLLLHRYIALVPMLQNKNERVENGGIEAMLQESRMTRHVSTIRSAVCIWNHIVYQIGFF